jgi:hypothetical protein
VYNVTTLTGLLGPVTEVVGMTGIVTPTRHCADQGEIKVEADDNTMLIMRHASGALSHECVPRISAQRPPDCHHHRLPLADHPGGVNARSW